MGDFEVESEQSELHVLATYRLSIYGNSLGYGTGGRESG